MDNRLSMLNLAYMQKQEVDNTDDNTLIFKMGAPQDTDDDIDQGATENHTNSTNEVWSGLPTTTLANSAPQFFTGTSDQNQTPISFIDGSALPFYFYGRTLINVITNGNFAASSSNLATGFILHGSTAVSCTNNTQVFIANGTSGQIDYGTAPIAGHRYYVSTNVLSTEPAVMLVTLYNTSSYKTAVHPGDGAYHTLSFIVDIASGFSTGMFYIQDSGTSGYSNISAQNFMAIDMGTDSSSPFYNLTAAQMTQMINGYVNGTQPIVNPQFKSTGKNLINPAAGSIAAGPATATQNIINGNFAASSSNLATGFVLNTATAVSCSGGIQTFIATAQNGSFLYNTSLTAGHRYFLIANIQATAAQNKVALTGLNTTWVDSTNALHPGDGAYHLLYGIATANSGAKPYIIDLSASGWQNISIQNFMAIDMGADSSSPIYNLTAAQMTVYCNSYFEGTKIVTLPLPASTPAAQNIKNGNFATSSSNLATGFTILNATAVSCVNNTQTFIPTSSSGQIYSQGVLLAGHRYFVSANVKAALPVRLRVVYDTSAATEAAHPGDSQYHTLSFITTITANVGNRPVVIYDPDSSGWQNISVQNLVAVDMGTDTTNPLYSFSVATMQSLVTAAGYWEGSANIGGITCAVAADGTIVLNGIAVSTVYITLAPQLFQSSSGFVTQSTTIITLTNGQKYTFSLSYLSGTVSGQNNVRVSVRDTLGTDSPTNFITDLVTDQTRTQTATAGTPFTAGASSSLSVGQFDMSLTAGVVLSNYTFRLQFEQAAAATSWEVHKESTLTITGTIGQNDQFKWDGNYGIIDGNPVPTSGNLLAYQNGWIFGQNPDGTPITIMPTLQAAYLTSNTQIPPNWLWGSGEWN